MFSPRRLAFYPLALRDVYEASAAGWPADGVPVDAETHAQMMEAQALGHIICADTNGRPMAKKPDPPSAETLAATERRWRDNELALTDPLVVRHRDELEVGTTTLTEEQYLSLQAYRRALRDWPEQTSFPEQNSRPVEPSWLIDQLGG